MSHEENPCKTKRTNKGMKQPTEWQTLLAVPVTDRDYLKHTGIKKKKHIKRMSNPINK